MDKMNQPPGGDPQDFWPTQELGPTAGPAGNAGPAGQAGPTGPAGHQPPGQPWSQPSGPAWQAGQAGQPWGQPTGPAWGQPSASAWGPSAGPGGPAGPAGPAWAQPSGPGGRPSSPRPGRSRVLWWSAGLALVALLAGGGVLAATASSSAAPTGPTGQAAVLNSMLNSASSPGADGIPGSAATVSATTAATCRTRVAKLKAAGRPFAARFALWRCRHALLEVRALGGIHGQFTFQTKTGTRTLAYERGTIQSVSGIDVVVRAKDGTTWTWVLGSNTVIRENGKRVTASALSDGENVFAGGPVVSGTYDARLIAIRSSSGTPSPSASPSPATGS